jgi:hypothetical protein
MSIYTAALDAVARHLPFAVVLVAGAILRTFVVFAYQPVLMLQRDTYAYLEMAAGKGQVGFRAPLYPLLLKPAVALGNLTVVAIFQHLVGLTVGIGVYVLLRVASVRVGGPELSVRPRSCSTRIRSIWSITC